MRQDNSAERMTPIGYQLGLVGQEQWKTFNERLEAKELYAQKLKSTWVNPKILSGELAQKYLGQELSHEYSLEEILKRPNIKFEHIVAIATILSLDPELSADFMNLKYLDYAKILGEKIETELKYSGYLERQMKEIERLNLSEHRALPPDIDYNSMSGLSTEVKQKLTQVRPETLGQASRISGIGPAAISIIMVYLKKQDLNKKVKPSLWCLNMI